ncbi:HAAS signaling domain-containing protein [Microbacterium sp. NPDC058345]|uniref:HAAS signaling domain-containing protein n=1 Tax=Microbacterium sp. NPDC058345 TaxID=3346455 RepID=UPI00364BB4F2
MITAAAEYLTRLDAALRDVPHGIASDIRAGIAEELSSLESDAAQARIAQLGDPEQIAREVMDAAGQATPVAVPGSQAPRVPLTRTRGFAIAAAITLGAGGFVVPIVGWFAGVVMVLMSAMWRTWEKLVAVLLPFVTIALVIAASVLSAAVAAESGGGSGEFAAPGANPLVPTWYDVGLMGWHSAILVGFVLVPVSGLWLLWRLRGRTPLDTTRA